MNRVSDAVLKLVAKHEDRNGSVAAELLSARKVVKEAQAIIDTRIWGIFSGVKSLDEALEAHNAQFPEEEGFCRTPITVADDGGMPMEAPCGSCSVCDPKEERVEDPGSIGKAMNLQYEVMQIASPHRLEVIQNMVKSGILTGYKVLSGEDRILCEMPPRLEEGQSGEEKEIFRSFDIPIKT